MKRLLALPLLCAAVPVFAQTLADPAAIDSAVTAFTGAAPGTPGGAAAPVDRRLRLIACPLPLVLDWYGARRDTVSVSCSAGAGWRLYVPLSGAGGGNAPPAIARGDAVTISASGEGFAVSQPGEAMEAGAVGAWIKVRSTAAGSQPLRARVIRPGLVGIALP